MGRTTPLHPNATAASASNGSPKRSATGLLETVTTIWAICTKQVSRARNKLKQNQTKSYDSKTPPMTPPRSPFTKPKSYDSKTPPMTPPRSPFTKPKSYDSKTPPMTPRSPLTKPKQLFATISNKAINFRHKKIKDDEFDDDAADDGFGDGGLWQRNILMGDKCQPLDFSGVIYYDNNGKRLNELPMRSPRASPLPSYVYSSAVKREY